MNTLHAKLAATAIATMLLPGTALCAEIAVRDTIAGLSTEITVTGLTPHAQTKATVLPPYGPAVVLPLSPDGAGKASAWIAGEELQISGDYAVRVSESDDGAAETVLRVLPDTVDQRASAVQMENDFIGIGIGADAGSVVRVILRDRFGNPLEGRSVELISSRSADAIEPLARETDASGEQQFLVRASQPGEIILRAIDLLSGKVIAGEIVAYAEALQHAVGGYAERTARSMYYPSATLPRSGLTGQTSAFQELRGFDITIIRQEREDIPTLRINEAESMIIEAVDQNGGRFYDYEGTVYLLSTDPQAELPKDGIVAFTFKDQGLKQFTLGLTFMTPGRHTLIITEDPDDVRSILGEIEVEVTGQAQSRDPNENIVIKSPLPDEVFNTRDITVEGAGPPLINIVVTGGVQTVEGATDIDGRFAIPVQLRRDQDAHIIQVEDKEGRFTSGERAIATDTTGPEILSAVYAPENPEEKADVLLVVESETDLRSARFTIDEREYILEPSGSDPKKYQILFSAPEGGDVFDGEIRLMDNIGNETVRTEPLAVNLRGLPRVENVVAEAQLSAVALRWDTLKDEEVNAYRIYVGTSAEESLYTLDTDRPTAAATVAGLRPGTTYYFSITALQGKRESRERSEAASATVLGVNLEVTPGDGSLFLEFSSLQQDIPLSHFILEYGTEPERYTEQRRLNGELRAYTLRDLINGVTYYVKLVPVTTTGERLDDLAANGQGTPTGAGYTVSASDPIPNDLELHSAAMSSGSFPPPTPTPDDLSPEGIPSPMVLVVVCVAVILFAVIMRRWASMRRTVAFLETMEGKYSGAARSL